MRLRIRPSFLIREIPLLIQPHPAADGLTKAAKSRIENANFAFILGRELKTRLHDPRFQQMEHGTIDAETVPPNGSVRPCPCCVQKVFFS